MELRRVDRAVRTDAYGEPAIRQRTCHIYDLRHVKGLQGTLSSLPQDTPPIFIEAASRRSLGNFALRKSLLRSHWKAQPVDTTGRSSRYNLTAFVRDATPLFEVRRRAGRYEWTEARGNAVGVEDGEGEEQHRLVVTACLQRRPTRWSRFGAAGCGSIAPRMRCHCIPAWTRVGLLAYPVTSPGMNMWLTHSQ